jgi:hypothetical protein
MTPLRSVAVTLINRKRLSLSAGVDQRHIDRALDHGAKRL